MDARHHLHSIAACMEKAGDRTQAEKMNQLARKMENGDFSIAFCGHFSAGKSTLVNRLCGARLLPSGPIPTSANVVSIRYGEESAKIWRKQDGFGQTRTVSETVSLEKLEAVCKDGDAVETVEIRYPAPVLKQGIVLLDTPGIDSTDAAHHAATESALHLADVVFYVMDYNYVQSEINFTFAKRLKDWGKPLYLLINQIDKHREAELPFDEYRKGVEEAFARWHIRPEGFLFVSLKDELHPRNEWAKLPELLHRLTEQAEKLKEWNVKRSAQWLIRDHRKHLEEVHAPEKELYSHSLGADGDLDEKLKRHEETLAALEALRKGPELKEAEWKKEIASIIENANLTPATTRDLAQAYLETRKPGFKVGLFDRAAKTEAERRRRLEAFTADFAEKLKAHLYWHTTDYLKKQAAEAGLSDSALAAAFSSWESRLTPEWLAAQVHSGADYSGEYTLTYSRHIASEAKLTCKREAYERIEQMRSLLERETSLRSERLEQELNETVVELTAYRAIQRLEQEEEEQERTLLSMAQKLGAEELEELALPDPSRMEVPSRGDQTVIPPESVSEPVADLEQTSAITQPRTAEEEPEDSPSSAEAGTSRSLEDTAARLREAAQALEVLQGMAPERRQLLEKAAKLENNRFTLALFGAFSAGKSSLANALMGSGVLPVSPNPTTAAINTIFPPTPENPHGTVRVRMKSIEVLREEILYSLETLGISLPDREESIDSLLDRVRRLEPETAAASGKAHLTFLKAMQKGWEGAVSRLGQELTVRPEEFGGYVADETLACFVSGVELYRETPLSEKGIILVDTPGADSINARHTGVTFQYLKNADAILFVTYYNHAFSQADREFLLQLGRVKDAFEMDKMFFLVNASDLASGPEELSAVLRHVEDNLLKHGVRNPRLYPVSSQQALAAKLAGDRTRLQASGMLPFEKELYSFASGELAGIAIHGAETELERALSKLDGWLLEARRDEGERQRRLEETEQALQAARERSIFRVEPDDLSGLRKETEELLYHVKQRMMHRFGDFYRASFNPAVIREDGGTELKQLFRAAWKDLLRQIGISLSQEVLATTLRLENFLRLRADERWTRALNEYTSLLSGFTAGVPSSLEMTTPSVGESLAAPEAQEKWLLSFYKNGRQFFEGEGNAKLKEAMELKLADPIAVYLQSHLELLTDHYASEWQRLLSSMAGYSREALDAYADGLLSVLRQGADTETLEAVRGRLGLLLHNK